VDGAGPAGGPRKAWSEIVGRDCGERALNREDAMGHGGWRSWMGDG